VVSPPIRETLIIPQGVTFSRRWRITDSVTGAPINLTGWSARGQIRAYITDVDTLFEFIGSGISVDASGYVTVSVTPEQSSAWDWRDGVYDIELIDLTGRVARIAQGAVRVSAEVTR
jgi:hypothetical protein